MADSGFLEKEYDLLSQGQAESQRSDSYDEAEEHRRRMAAKFEELCARPVDYAKYAERARESYFSSDRGENRYSDYAAEKVAPAPEPVSYQAVDAVPAVRPSGEYSEENRASKPISAPDVAQMPSALSRINDYMESSRRIEEMKKSMQAPSETVFATEAAAIFDGSAYAPEVEMQTAPEDVIVPEEAYASGIEMQAVPEYMEEPQFAAPRDEYMGWLYREGIVQSQELAPSAEVPAATMPFHDFSADPYRTEEESSEIDAKPTEETMQHYREEEEVEDETDTVVTSALTSKTKIVLASIAAAIMILLAVICINAAIIKSLNADVSFREQTVTNLSETLRGIRGEIDELTDPENIENWAAEHGMTPPES